MKDLKVVFMGTPEFSINVLDMLCKNTNVLAVVTQPDKEVGRKKILTYSPVKEYALKNNIKVLQPKRLKDEYQCIIDLNPDIIITCAYGQILPFELLDYPKYKTINVHASLLPNYRGGAPIERSIMSGDKVTGVTIMRTDVGMDDGDIIEAKEVEILDTDDIYTLSKKLSCAGAEVLLKVLPKIIDGTCKYIKQDRPKATFAYVIKREDEKIDFSDSAINIYNKIRALSKIGAYVINDNKETKIYKARITNKKGDIGTISGIYKDGFGIYCSDGEIIVLELQESGKKKMSTKDYLNGVKKEELLQRIYM